MNGDHYSLLGWVGYSAQINASGNRELVITGGVWFWIPLLVYLILCIVIVTIGFSPAVRLYDTQ